jgi:hypothetical protein
MYTHSLINSHAFVMYIMSSSSFLFFFWMSDSWITGPRYIIRFFFLATYVGAPSLHHHLDFI